MENQATILVIGRPESGKTTFKAQLLNRLLDGDNNEVRIDPIPDKLSQVMEDRKAIKQGCAVQRTQFQVEIKTDLSLKFLNGRRAIIPYRDYSGEKINRIMETRIVSDDWAKQIRESQAWLLFISPHQLKPNDNIYTKPRATDKQKADANDIQFELTDTAYFIELIQILLFIKGLGTFQPIKNPVLQIVLSRCDKIGLKAGMIAKEALRKRLPIFVEFLESVWDGNALSFIGLSSIGKELKTDSYDEDFIDEGAHKFGYIVLPNGEESKDLTIVISNLLNMLT